METAIFEWDAWERILFTSGLGSPLSHEQAAHQRGAPEWCYIKMLTTQKMQTEIRLHIFLLTLLIKSSELENVCVIKEEFILTDGGSGNVKKHLWRATWK